VCCAVWWHSVLGGMVAQCVARYGGTVCCAVWWHSVLRGMVAHCVARYGGIVCCAVWWHSVLCGMVRSMLCSKILSFALPLDFGLKVAVACSGVIHWT